MLRFRNAASLLIVVCLAPACGRDPGPEPIEQCLARFAKVAQDLPIPAGRVYGNYTFDLSKMDRDRIEQVMVTGVNGEGRPRLMAANQDSNALRKKFSAVPLSQRGLMLIANSSVLLRMPTGPHQSASEAFREGCRLIPGARLQAVALTAG